MDDEVAFPLQDSQKGYGQQEKCNDENFNAFTYFFLIHTRSSTKVFLKKEEFNLSSARRRIQYQEWLGMRGVPLKRKKGSHILRDHVPEKEGSKQMAILAVTCLIYWRSFIFQW
jgi:hypothetical protein